MDEGTRIVEDIVRMERFDGVACTMVLVLQEDCLHGVFGFRFYGVLSSRD